MSQTPGGYIDEYNQLRAAGENVKVVSERLGHASAVLTLDVHSHVLPDMQQRAAEKLEAVLFPASASAG